ncbi:MAG: succinate dehydrogenase assembly factor 2 [Rhodospirillales bacterium]|nr:succinate dehydrogenase assembly factor 2 [Rhodospirillales bacterium]
MDIRRKRLLYQSTHRGTKESDVLIGGFAAAYLARLTEPQLDRFEALLQETDADLVDWIMEKTQAPARHDHDVLALIRARKRER